jgi:hypothetical protein
VVVDHFFTGSLAALLGTASVATVRCPACQQAVYEDTPTCPHCGLVLGVLDRAFGVPPIIGESVCDLRRQLSKKERKELGRMVDRFERRFPQVTVVVVLCKPPEGVPLAGYTFWIFNHSRAVSLLERGGENRQVMLTLDLEAEQVACMIGYGLEPLITDDHLTVEEAIAAAAPELVLGTQMERHIAKRLGVGCAVISAPAHVQDYPARFSPQMGFEGANVLFDTWVHPLVMGLEEHLLAMFREDFEFNDGAGASHLAAHQPVPSHAPAPVSAPLASELIWSREAEAELTKIPFFVRGKARRNTERFATEQGLAVIKIETLYDAKSHYAR